LKDLNKYIINLSLEKIQILKTFLIVLLIFLITGCGVWTNFKTYFNTYYNANRIFQETEETLLESKKELFSFEEEVIPKNLSSNFDEVIEKTSAILQHNKESSYVDEALLMTGKSFYYQQNYSRALRKFNELTILGESELLLENNLWIAKTQLQLREFNKGLKNLDEVKVEAIAAEEDEILIEVYKSKIGYFIYNEEYNTAVVEINDFLNVDISDELIAEVLYELGLLYKLNEDYESAEKAFAQVEDYSPTFEVDFDSKFEVAILQAELGNVDNSLELLQKLREEDKFSDSWDLIDLEIGKIFYDKNEIDKAFDKFTEVDTTYSKTEASGISGFYRAEILENYYHDYDSALGFYQKVASSSAPQSIRTLAQKKSGQLNKYISFHNQLRNLEVQFTYLSDSNAFIQDSLDYIEKVRFDSIRIAEELEENKDLRGNKQKPKPTYKKPERPKISIDSVHALNSKYYYQLANLLFSEFDDPDSAYHYYELSLREKEENPNQAQTYFAIGNYFLIKNDKAKADSMFTLVYDKFQFDPIRNEAAKQIGKPLYDFDKDPVEEEFMKAEAIYDSLNFTKAIKELFTIYDKNPTSIYASKSLYTIGFILENNLDMPDSAASIYDTLTTKYKSSEYAKSVQIRLGGYKQEQKKLEAIQDSIKKANEVVELDSIKSASKQIEEESTIIDSVNSQVPINIESVKDSTIIDSVNSQAPINIEPVEESAIIDSVNSQVPINIESVRDSNAANTKKIIIPD